MAIRTAALLLLLGFAAAAQGPSEPPPREPPKVLRIVRQVIKPGKTAAQEKIASAAVRAMSRTKYPANLLALSSLSGDDEVWTLESHDSFVSVENADAFVEKTPALKWSLGQYEAQAGESIAQVRRLLAIYRPDLSYHGAQLAQDLPKMRYVSVVIVRLHPSRDSDFSEAVRVVTAAYEKINSDQPLVVYQVVSGESGPAYLFLSPMASLKTMDDAPLRGKAIREAVGDENAGKMLKVSAEVTAGTETFLFTLNPRLSYVSREFASVDPDFWTPKPPPKPPAVPGAPVTPITTTAPPQD